MTQWSLIQRLFQYTLNLLYPPQCASCDKLGSHFCDDCRANLAHLRSPICQKCGHPLTNLGSDCNACPTFSLSNLNLVRSVAFFDETYLQPAIHKFKYHNQRVLTQDFANLLKDCYDASQLATDIIVPVPLHRSRYKERGYNQSTLLAKGLSSLIDQSVDEVTLVRRRATKTQTSLNPTERQQNVRDAFACLSDALSYKTVLLIDDVFTTGATMNACGQALRQAGVASIYGLTLARAR